MHSAIGLLFYHFCSFVVHRAVARSLSLGGLEPMASAEREPITGVWGGAPSGVQGQSPWWGVRGAKPP